MVTYTSFNTRLADFKESADMVELAQKAQASIALPTEAEIREVSETLDRASAQIKTLDQERAALGLPDTFLQDELVCMEILRSSMEGYFDSRARHFAESARSLGVESADDLASSQLTVVEPLVSYLPMPETDIEEFISRDEIVQLPKLEKIRDLPTALAAQEALVDDYNGICDQLVHLSAVHAEPERLIENARRNVALYVSDFKKDMGLVEGREYSDVFRFYKVGNQLQDLDAIARAEPSEELLGAIKAQATIAVQAIERSNRLETIEAYIRIQAFYTYSEYIDQHYIDSKSAQERFNLKVQIATALDIGSYFYAKTGDRGSFREMRLDEKVYQLQVASEKDKYVRQFDDLIEDDILKAALDEQVSDLVETLHRHGLIVETVSGGLRPYTPKEIKYFEKVGLDFSGTDKRSSFRVCSSKDASAKIDQCVLNFVLELTSGEDAVLDDAEIDEMTPFNEQQGALFVKSRKSKSLQEVLNSRGSSLIKRLGDTSQSEYGLKGALESTKCDLSILSYNSSMGLVPEIKGKEKLLQAKIVFLVDRLRSELGLVKQTSAVSIFSKLAEVGEALQKPVTALAGEILGQLESYRKDHELVMDKRTVEPDMIRNFFVALVRQNLNPQYEELATRRAAFIQAFQSSSDQVDVSKLDALDAEFRELESKKATFASHIYNLYRSLYDTTLEGSIAFEIKKAKENLKEGCAPEAEIKSLEIAIEGISSLSDYISPSLIADLKQAVTTLKTQALLRNMQVVATAKDQAEALGQELEVVKGTYKDLKPVKKSKDRVSKSILEARQAALDESLVVPLTAAVKITAQAEVLDRRIKDLSAPLSLATEFDPQFSDDAQVERLAQLGQILNPSLQIWTDAHRMQAGITDAAIIEFGDLARQADSTLGLSLRSSPVSSASSVEEDDLTGEVIDAAIDALHDVEYFCLDLKAEALPTPTSALIPNLVEGNLFAKFSESKIAQFLVNAYLSATSVLTLEYKEELQALDSSTAQKKMEHIAVLKSSLEDQDAYAEEILATSASYIEMKLKKEGFKEVVEGLNLLRTTSDEVQLKIESIERKKSLLQSTLENADITLDDESVVYSQTKLASLEENKRELLAGLVDQAAELGLVIAPQSNIGQMQSAIEVHIQTLQTRIEEMEKVQSPSDKYAELQVDTIIPLQEEIEALEEEIRMESSATQEFVHEDLSVQLRSKKMAYLELVDKINRRAILASFKVFGLSCSSQALQELIALSARIRKEAEETI